MASVESLAAHRPPPQGEAANPWEGQVPLQFLGRVVKVRITMRVAGALHAEFGDDWGPEASKAFDGPDVDKLAQLFSVLTSGEIEPEAFLDAWPPPSVVELKMAFTTAHNLFWMGPPGLQLLDDDEDKEAEPEGGGSPLPPSTLWSRYGPRLLRQVWRRATSGRVPPTR